MKKRKANISKKVGLPPESLVYTGTRKPSPAEIELLVYNSETCETTHIRNMHKLAQYVDKERNNLLIINNLTDVTLIENVGKFFNIHPMVLEDVLNTTQMPKVEESGDQLLLTLKLLEYPVDSELYQQHLSFVLGEYYVIVFKDFENKLFNDLKHRIVSGKSRARQKKVDYLFYLLIDTLIDSYYTIVNEIDNRIDKLEEKLMEEPALNSIQDIYQIKRPMGDLRGVIYPIREAILNIVQGDFPLLREETITYLHDVKDHISHVIHMYESGRETLADLIDLNSSNINNRLNSSMNILTIITTLFIPLTLIAGIYGMNFKYMPEISWKWGYLFAIILMLMTAGIMYYIMKRKKLL
jgi:magnesium transporter